MKDALFEIMTPLGFIVRCSRSYWKFLIGQKHPIMSGQEERVKLVLSQPDEIRRSRKDPKVFLFYKGAEPRWICVVTKRRDESGFLITAYPQIQ